MSLRSQPIMGDPLLTSRTQRLIFGRLGLIVLLLTANLWRSTGAVQGGYESSPVLVIVFGLTVGLSVVYLFALRFADTVLNQVRIQFAVDLGLITWLVWQTGDIISPYVTLYIVLISVSGFFLGKLETLWLAITCAVVFTALSGLAAQDLFQNASGDQPGSRILQIVGINDVAILLVGLLAARLSERRQLAEELKHTEESFADLHLLHERIVESIGTGLITTDLSGRIYTYNRAAETIIGKKPAAVIGRSVEDLFGGRMWSRIQEHITSGSVSFETEYLSSGEGSLPLTIECTAVPLKDRSGETKGLIITFQDVTQVRELEESVRRSDRLAAVGRMAAGLAHEIRNPLGSMSSALQFLQERSTEQSDDRRLMSVVLRESDRLGSIITNFLAFARPSANGSGRHRDQVDIGAALRDCVSLIRHSPEVSGSHAIELQILERPARMLADETEIKQVFWNLARNAIQAMPNGGKLAIRLARAASDRILIEFSDTGVGISEEALGHIFEPFMTGSEGTGLGLSIVYKIVSDHGGTIDIQSRPGEGTRVTIVFREVFANGD